MAGVVSVIVDIITWVVYFVWTKWTIEIVVVSSFVLQLVLFFLSGDRRRRDTGFVRGLIWYSYQLADYLATYGLGHLSVSTPSVPWERQQLVVSRRSSSSERKKKKAVAADGLSWPIILLAGVIHTWHGYCIRVVSPLATAVALLLLYFHLSTTSDGGHGSAVLVDIAITYTLLVGAILLDMVSLVSAAGSTWAYAYLVLVSKATPRHVWLYHEAVCNRRWHRLHRVLEYIRRRFNADDGRSWSGEIGKHTMLVQKHEKKGWCQELAKKMGLQEAPSTVSIPPKVMELEQILVWHIATDVFLRRLRSTRERSRSREDEEDNSAITQLRLEAIELLSNYLMFILVERPHMLPGLALRRQYKETSKHLERIRSTSGDDDDDDSLANMLYTSTSDMTNDTALRGSALDRAAGLARTLFDYVRQPAVKVEFLFDMWVELLLHVGHQCSRESHAKQLSNGGELTTLVWLLAELAGKFYIDKEIEIERVRHRRQRGLPEW
uniref:DUF4220 domain-containing protein n=1 Tax=Leersia perrieri TaxID=77586 RepID=A0A0D9W2S8_9ORYZ